MQRISQTPRLLAPFLRISTSSPRIIQRQDPGQGSQPALPPSTQPYGTTSSPKAAEKASAQSGGSRSKDAVEKGEVPTAGVVPDPLADADHRGRTGGGKPLESSHHAPAQPKIDNGSVPGHKPELNKEQQAEVDAHNREFEAKHDKAAPAAEDKVNKGFWSGTGSREDKKKSK